MKSGVLKAPPRTIEYRSYRNYDKESFITELKETDWGIVDAKGDVDSAVDMFNTLYTDIADRHAPIKKARIKDIKTPWMTSDLKNAMRDRDYHHKKAIKTNSKYHWELFKKIKNFVNKQVKKCKADYYSDQIEQNKGNPSVLWKTFNEITSRKSSPKVTSIESDGVLYTDNESKANLLNTHFSLIGLKLATKIKEKIQPVVSDTTMCFSPAGSTAEENSFSFSYITESFVLKHLKGLKTNKAIGLDRISGRLLRDSADCIAPVLTRLFNRSLQTSAFPAIWKQGKVTALFKAGDRTDCNNYRSITVLPTISKILKRAVHIQLYGYLSESKLLTQNQFGFRPKLSTVTALAHFTDNILQSLDSGCMTGAVFIDLSKAFDTVDHEILVRKLKSIGVSTQVEKWFVSYLNNRHQVTSIENCLSPSHEVRVGVPQGSILGPLLFLIYINDLPHCLEYCKVVMYADDTVLYYSGKSCHEIESHLNADLGLITIT